MSTVIQVDPEALRTIVQAVVSETLRAVEADRARIPAVGRLAFSKVEAAGATDWQERFG